MKKKKSPTKVNITALAERAQCSRQLASRLLQRGFTEAEIVSRVRERKALEEARAAARNSGQVNGIAVTPAVAWPSFAESERRKEFLLSELRNVQLMKERGELLPVSYIRLWASRLLVEAKDILLAGPSELQDMLADERDPVAVNAILSRWLERAMDKFVRCAGLWGEGPGEVM